MSVLKEAAYTSPSRVIGVCKYLLQTKSHREKRDKLYQILSPENLLVKKGRSSSTSESLPKEEAKKASREMIKVVVRQCINMGLLVEDEGEITINPQLHLRHEKQLPSVIANLFFSVENSENHDFAKVLAWYLAQDFYNAPGNWQAAEPLLREQIGFDLLEFNSPRYGQFDDWSCYLGFSWRIALPKHSTITIPDPTVYLRDNLKYIFENKVNQQIPFAEFINRLGQYCPVFETGHFREEIEQQIPREPNYLSTVTSMAVRRLAEEGLLKFEKLADAPETPFVLFDGTEEIQSSHVTWLVKDGGRP